MSDTDPLAKALKMAYTILARQDRSERELRDKLKQRGFPPDIITATLTSLKASGYLNDERYLLAAARSLAVNRRQGNIRIEMILRGKGFTKEDIRTVLARVRQETDEGEVLLQLIAREREKNPLWDIKTKRRLFNRLVHRGFAPAQIFKYLGEYEEEFIDDHDGQ